ncbi:MAG: hypothetical protein ACLST1_08920 [[Eubacterium] siraeum]
MPSLVGENPLDYHKIYEATRVTATMKEMENFCNRYVKTLQLKVNSEENLGVRYRNNEKDGLRRPLF